MIGDVGTWSGRRVLPGTVAVRVLDGERRRRSADTCVDRQRSSVTGRRTVAVVGRNLALVPAAVVLERVQYVLTVGVDEVGPRLPEWMNDVVDEADLNEHREPSVSPPTCK